MSFTRSFTKSIKYVSVFDPAIDWDRDAPADEKPEARDKRIVATLTAYRETPDYATLPLRTGEQPCVFELAPLSMMARARVEQYPEGREVEQSIEAVACALRSVTGCTYDGEPVVIELKDGRVRGPVLERLYQAVGSDVFAELRHRILTDSRLGPTSR